MRVNHNTHPISKKKLWFETYFYFLLTLTLLPQSKNLRNIALNPDNELQ